MTDRIKQDADRGWNLAAARQNAALRAMRPLAEALEAIDGMNFGQAKILIERARAHLPWDRGEGGVVWPDAEPAASERERLT